MSFCNDSSDNESSNILKLFCFRTDIGAKIVLDLDTELGFLPGHRALNPGPSNCQADYICQVHGPTLSREALAVTNTLAGRRAASVNRCCGRLNVATSSIAA